ncbi:MULTISPECIES: LysE family translocator [Rhizobium/Agrobacterium group]|jgi:threonine/homoserine/homoserine lactone efflux protein|uniref:Threonine/homoserine/homoserine lactone efflux protein n=1 Tax=Rhizobium soli TaxID=424798 RepID=A0A7X0JJI3_9HYPH|nr:MULTISPECIES: LysE family translocator [Rhizobium/Agrobacterium group]KQQ34185.1 threonine transporter RhtB [Rhizobium sp. Leaf306]KQQ70546.1 threonine transporter RhtB [Rhizobium sp. Leaf321]MBB6508765.1 threonine/homoserine/homoserine lactone efflux protein [Rhizobium soli]MBD8652040.1 LysE family translocator [Rhizobium sp. CFBP 13726]MBD8661766.1 LysE family translocator [Rhizobium sp. CFBP 8752]
MEFLPSLASLLAFTAAGLLLALTPGPDMTLSISRALAQGRRSALFVVLGTSLGVVCHTLLVAFGISALITASPTAFFILKTGGAAYLLWLAIQAIRFGSSFSVETVERATASPLANISIGFWVNILNPKVIIFFMTFLPQFVTATDPHVTGKLVFFGIFFIAIGMPVNLIVVLAADRLANWLQRNPKVLRGLDYTFAGVFSVFAVKIFMTQSR